MAQTTLARGTTTLTTSTAAFLTAAALEALVVSKVTVCNTSASPVTIDVHAVPNAGSAATGNKIVSALAINAGDTVTVPGMAGTFVVNGQSLHAKASTGAVVNLDWSAQRTAQAA